MSTPSQAAQGTTTQSADAGASQSEVPVARRISVDSKLTDDFTAYGEPAAAGQAAAASPETSPNRSGADPPLTRSSSAHTGRSSHENWSQANPQLPDIHTSYAGSAGAPSNRPPTSHSRTHVPSLTAQAFYRPMSSQKLQAQRSQRPQLLLSGSARPQEMKKMRKQTTKLRSPVRRNSMKGASLFLKDIPRLALHFQHHGARMSRKW